MKAKVMKKVFALFLAFIMLMTSAPVGFYATTDEISDSTKEMLCSTKENLAKENEYENCEIPMAYAMSQSYYIEKRNAFINDARWKNGVWWGNQSPKYSYHSSTQCKAYVDDFVAYIYGYMYGASNTAYARTYSSVSNIQAGDVLHINNSKWGQHWIAILDRNGNSLYTAEGNVLVNGNTVVKISNDTYTINGNNLYSSYVGGTYTLTQGYNYDTISSDITAPTISNAYIADVTDTGYTVYCTATDNVGVSKVAFPTWTQANDQDDLAAEWYNTQAVYQPVSGNTYCFKVKTSDHNNETGTYITHVYAYDAVGNNTCVPLSVVIQPATGVTLNKSSVTLSSTGATTTLTATVSPSNATNKSVTWKSSNTSVATVDSSGVVTAVGNGTATITATTASGGKTATCNVTVSIATTGVSLNKTSATLTSKGATVALTATVSPSNAANKSVTWKSSNTSVATVNSSGVVTAVGNGTATITVTTASGGKTATCKVTVSIKEEILIPTPAKPHKITNIVSGVHVYWNAVDGASKYGLWRSENGQDGTYECITNLSEIHFIDTTVESGKTYYYKVSVLDTSTNTYGNMSETLGITFVGTPDITSRINKSAGIQLGWQKIDGATGYAIYRKSYSGNDAWTRVATIEGNDTFSWIDTSVKDKNGTIYKYTIRALAGEDMKTLSGCRNTGRTMVRLSSRVLNSATKASKTAIKCNWTTSSAVTGYEVRFMVGDEIYKTVTVGNYKTGTKTFTGLKTGQTYKVQVRSYKKVNGVGTFYSAWSTEKNVTLK